MPPHLAFPFVDAGVANAVLPAELRDGHARLLLLQDRDDLLLAEPAALHVLVLSLGQNELHAGLGCGGNVKRR